MVSWGVGAGRDCSICARGGQAATKVSTSEIKQPLNDGVPLNRFTCAPQNVALPQCAGALLPAFPHSLILWRLLQVAELAPESCRGVERAVPFLTADEGIGCRVVLEAADSAITGCACSSCRVYPRGRKAGPCRCTARTHVPTRDVRHV